MATQKQVFTEAHENIDKANHTTNGLIEYLRYIFGKLENATGGGGGGSEVSYTQTLTSGTETGTIKIDGVSTKMYAPTPAAPTEVEVTQVISSGSKIATISVDNVPTDIYAPASGGGGESIKVTGDGTKTFTQLLNALYALIDPAKINLNSFLTYGTVKFNYDREISGAYHFSNSNVTASNFEINTIIVDSAASHFYNTNRSTNSNYSNNAVDSGIEIKLYY